MFVHLGSQSIEKHRKYPREHRPEQQQGRHRRGKAREGLQLVEDWVILSEKDQQASGRIDEDPQAEGDFGPLFRRPVVQLLQGTDAH